MFLETMHWEKHGPKWRIKESKASFGRKSTSGSRRLRTRNDQRAADGYIGNGLALPDAGMEGAFSIRSSAITRMKRINFARYRRTLATRDVFKEMEIGRSQLAYSHRDVIFAGSGGARPPFGGVRWREVGWVWGGERVMFRTS